MENTKCFVCLEATTGGGGGGAGGDGNNGEARGKLLSLAKLVETSASISDKDELSFCERCRGLLMAFSNLQEKFILAVNDICELMMTQDEFGSGQVGVLRKNIISKCIAWLVKMNTVVEGDACDDDDNSAIEMSALNNDSSSDESGPDDETSSTHSHSFIGLAKIKVEPPDSDSEPELPEANSSMKSLKDPGNNTIFASSLSVDDNTSVITTASLADVKIEVPDSESETAAEDENPSELSAPNTPDPSFEESRHFKVESPFRSDSSTITAPNSPTPANVENDRSAVIPARNLNSSLEAAAQQNQDFVLVHKGRNAKGYYRYIYQCLICDKIVKNNKAQHLLTKSHQMNAIGPTADVQTESTPTETSSTRIGFTLSGIKAELSGPVADQSEGIEAGPSDSSLQGWKRKATPTAPGTLRTAKKKCVSGRVGVSIAELKTELNDADSEPAERAEDTLPELSPTRILPDPLFEEGRTVLKLESPYTRGYRVPRTNSPTPTNSSSVVAAEPTQDYVIAEKKRINNGQIRYIYRCLICDVLVSSMCLHRRTNVHQQKLTGVGVTANEPKARASVKRSCKSKLTVPKIVRVTSQKTSETAASAPVSQQPVNETGSMPKINETVSPQITKAAVPMAVPDQSAGQSRSKPKLPLPYFLERKGTTFKYNMNMALYFCTICKKDIIGSNVCNHKKVHFGWHTKPQEVDPKGTIKQVEKKPGNARISPKKIAPKGASNPVKKRRRNKKRSKRNPATRELPDFMSWKGKIYMYNSNQDLYHCSICKVDVVEASLQKHKKKHGIKN